MIRRCCPCGWPKPLIAVTTPSLAHGDDGPPLAEAAARELPLPSALTLFPANSEDRDAT